MKPIHFILPALALAGVLAWHFSQRGAAISGNTREPARSREISAPDRPPRAHTEEKFAAPSAEEWKQIAGKLSDDSDDEKSLRELDSFHDRVGAMSGNELVEALVGIDDLDLPDEEKEALRDMLLDPLIEKDPRLALEKFSGKIKGDPDGIGYALSSALAGWAKQDLNAATAWLDQQISAGTFESAALDGRNDMLLDYEAAIVGELLAANPEEARRRLTALPEIQRAEALQRIAFSDLEGSAPVAYADMIRSVVPQDERAGAFVYVMDEIVPDGGFAAVDEFFKQTNASPEESAVAAREAANQQLAEIAGERAVTSADVDEMRAWLQKYSPEQVNESTGRAIAEATQDGGDFGFNEASDLVRQYFQKTGDDKVIEGFLESFAARSNLDQAKSLAELLKDPTRRQEILEGLE